MSVPELPPIPSDPRELIDWVEKLDPEQQHAFLDQVRSGPAFGAMMSPGFVDSENPQVDLPPAPAAPMAYTLRIDISDAKPPIWRRLVVRSDVTLDVLHTVIQAAFGWWDSHLHRFSLGDPYTGPYFVTQYDIEEEGDTGTLEQEARLDQVLTEPGDRLTYEYDFGDGWTHEIKLETVEAWSEEEGRTVWCVTGRNAGPLEDCGGIWSYNELAAWVRSDFAPDKAPPNADDLEDWIPEDFDPDDFDVEDTNDAIEVALLGDAGVIARTLGLRDEAVAFAQSLAGESGATVARWLIAGGFGGAQPGAGQPLAADPRAGQRRTAPLVDVDLAASATRPWRVLLHHVGEGVTLTKAGYLPPAVVEAVWTELDLDAQWIGKGNREDHTLPVLLLRESAQDLGLLRKSKGRLAPTAAARKTRDDPVALLRHIAARLPLGKRQDEQQAGWVVLVATAAGEGRQATGRHLASILTDLGWTTSAGPLDARSARVSGQPTRHVLETAAGELVFSRREVPGPEAVALARLALVGG